MDDPGSGVEFLDDNLAELIDALRKEYHVPGLSIAVVDNGKVTAKVRLSKEEPRRSCIITLNPDVH